MILIQKQKYAGGIKANGPLDVSGNRLAESLGIKVYTNKIKCKKNLDNIVINWGLSKINWWSDNDILINNCYSVGVACNKLLTFKVLDANYIPCPTYCTNTEAVSNWFDMSNKTIVFCRTLLSGKKGEGIVVARKSEELVDAPLYTLYVPKVAEYRVHVAFDKAIHIQKKIKLTTEELKARGITERNPLIRNLSNGYVFTSNIPFEYEDDGSYKDTKFFWITEHSIHAVQALGLDFGAVDIIVGKDGKVYVLEINTAPGIEGKTLEDYTSAFKDRFNLT